MTSEVVKMASRTTRADANSSEDFTPREYQTILYERAKDANTIICLGTGCGKTFISVMLIREKSGPLRVPWSEGGQRTVFVVPTKPLANQHRQTIAAHTDLAVKVYTGDDNVDEWSKECWHAEFQTNQVLIMVGEVLRLIVSHGILPLSRVNLLIFDEVHWASTGKQGGGAHPYTQIMDSYKKLAPNEKPLILGLTPSLISKRVKPSEVHTQIKQLEDIMESKVETIDDIKCLNKYGATPEMEELDYSHVASFADEDIECINDHLLELGKIISYLNRCIHDNIELLKVRKSVECVAKTASTMGVWAAYKLCKIYSSDIGDYVKIHQTTRRNLAHIMLVVKGGIDQGVSLYGKRLNHFQSNYDRLIRCSSPKMRALLTKLREYAPSENNKSKKPLCGIVFVEQKKDVFLISLWLKEIAEASPEEFGFLKVNYVVGHTINTSNLKLIRNQEEVLTKFRKHELNLLISTSVLEEGLDVPRCNLVIRYDFPATIRQYIQSKGRARSDGSKYVIFCTDEEKERAKQKKYLHEYLELENLLQSDLREKLDGEATEFNDENELRQLAQKYTYYPTGDTNEASLTLHSAIQVINRYCMKLPSDSFTKLVPRATISAEGGKYRCELRLPINSPLRCAIKGDLAPSKKLAKKIAAFQACYKLHEMKELDDHLLPVGKENLKYLCEELGFEPYGEEFEQFGKDCKDKPRPGTTKRRQYYAKLTADVLRGPPPAPASKCYLYIFTMRLSCRIPDEQNTRKRKISDPADTSRSFGIIIPHKVPEICDFPVFTRSGEVTVSLQESSAQLTLTQEEIEKISSFHHYTFHSVLKVDPFPIKFDICEANTNYYLVPVFWNKRWDADTSSWVTQNDTKDAQIDWDIMQRVEEYKLKDDLAPDDKDRENFVFREADFNDAVVKRWYFKSREEFFYVAEICHGQSPLSPFPDPQFTNFAHYYREKYKIELKNMTQPLLDVDHTSARLNLLTPRYVNRKGVSLSTTKKERKENIPQKLHLMPELCLIHPFPASFWRKTVTLPCILYRMNVLLNAEQLRSRIARDIGIGPVTLQPGQKWPPLDFGWPLYDANSTAAQEKCSTPEPMEIQPVKKQKTVPVESNHQSFAQPARENSLPDSEKMEQGDGQDFLIDTFDPEKHKVLDEVEEKNMFFNSVDKGLFNCKTGGTFEIEPFNPISSWKQDRNNKAKIVELNDDSSDETVNYDQIRGGSPSILEDAKWDKDTDTFIPVGLPVGLERISVTQEFDAESLLRDLSKQRDFEDDYDSDDEIDDDDDEDMDISPSDGDFQHSASPIFINTNATSKNTNESTLPFKLLDEVADMDENPEEPPTQDQAEPGVKLNVDILMEELSRLVSDPISPHCEPPQGQRKEVTEEAVVRKETNFGELLPKSKRNRESTIECSLKFDAYKDQLNSLVGPSPNEILQALTMSNASDGINLERLETVGDSFLKYAVTLFLYCKCERLHEGKLSYLRSRQISNYNLYRLGKRKGLGEYIIATKFEPNDNWLPPGYYIPKGLDEALMELGEDAAVDLSRLQNLDIHSKPQEEVKAEILKIKDQIVLSSSSQNSQPQTFKDVDKEKTTQQKSHYNLTSQQSIPDKSIADCVEALIGAYLLHAGPKGALYFMRWLNLKVMETKPDEPETWNSDPNDPIWHHMPPVNSPVTYFKNNDEDKNIDLHYKEQMYKLYHDSGLENFEQNVLNYSFKDKSYLIQAFTHNSYFENQITDCYQRLEFLGDAILDYLVTRMLYEDQRKHSPGILTDLRSALVNNTFFASLAVEYQFHKYLKNTSSDLYKVMNAFVSSSLAKADSETGSTGLLGLYRTHCSTIIGELETENLGEVEVPKALGDIFESVAGAIFLDSGMSLDTVWKVYYPMMKPEIEHFSENVPKSPIRELLELEPQNAQFG